MHQLAVGIVQNLMVGDAEDSAGGGELGSTLPPELSIVLHSPAIMRRLAVGETQQAGFHTIAA
jgi:hypothetical protein